MITHGLIPRFACFDHHYYASLSVKASPMMAFSLHVHSLNACRLSITSSDVLKVEEVMVVTSRYPTNGSGARNFA